MKNLASLLLLLPMAAWQASAQAWDTSGNGLLNGAYYFRHIAWQVSDSSGDLGGAEAIFGTITFDGNGNYNISGAQITQPNGNGGVGTQAFGPVTGTYSIAASGYGFMTSPVNSSDLVYGLVSQGIFIGSATENPSSSTAYPYNDLLIAAQLAQPQPTNAFFHGTYNLVDVDSPTGTVQDTFLSLTPDGNGNLGTMQANAYVPALTGSLSPVQQTISGQKYFFSNGAANVAFGGCSSTSVFCGTRYLYFSADGNFVFGGAPNGWDMLVGVRSPTTTPNFNGLYYQASFAQDLTGLVSGAGATETISYFGSLYAIPNSGSSTAGQILDHERILSVPQSMAAIDYSYGDIFSLGADGTYVDETNRYLFGADGIRIGFGDPNDTGGAVLGINVAIQAPTFNVPGVYINPTGVQNAASSAPFTAGIAPGEIISISGTNLAPDALADARAPFTLGGVQVKINGRPAPIDFVSPGQIYALVPYGTVEPIASIQVINNKTASNTVSAFVNATAPGVFTNPGGGLGEALAEHADSSLVTADHPAAIGETLQVFVAGLGDVTPTIADGVPSSGNPPNQASNAIAVVVGGVQATVAFAELATGYPGLYRISFEVPTGVSSGNVHLDVSGPDYYASEAQLAIASTTAAIQSAQPAVRRQRRPIGQADPKFRRRP
jgi:uncharacterized protein (TIGR03437 family)